MKNPSSDEWRAVGRAGAVTVCQTCGRDRYEKSSTNNQQPASASQSASSSSSSSSSSSIMSSYFPMVLLQPSSETPPRYPQVRLLATQRGFRLHRRRQEEQRKALAALVQPEVMQAAHRLADHGVPIWDVLSTQTRYGDAAIFARVTPAEDAAAPPTMPEQGDSVTEYVLSDPHHVGCHVRNSPNTSDRTLSILRDHARIAVTDTCCDSEGNLWLHTYGPHTPRTGGWVRARPAHGSKGGWSVVPRVSSATTALPRSSASMWTPLSALDSLISSSSSSSSSSLSSSTSASVSTPATSVDGGFIQRWSHDPSKLTTVVTRTLNVYRSGTW
jgi:hypothetical protein